MLFSPIHCARLFDMSFLSPMRTVQSDPIKLWTQWWSHFPKTRTPTPSPLQTICSRTPAPTFLLIVDDALHRIRVHPLQFPHHSHQPRVLLLQVSNLLLP